MRLEPKPLRGGRLKPKPRPIDTVSMPAVDVQVGDQLPLLHGQPIVKFRMLFKEKVMFSWIDPQPRGILAVWFDEDHLVEVRRMRHADRR